MILYGVHPVGEALDSSPDRLEGIWITRGARGARIQKIIDASRRLKIPLHFESEAVLRRKAETDSHQNVVAQMSPLGYASLEEILEAAPRWLVLLDQVEDPHNLGAVLRTAEAAGAGAVLIPRRGSCGLTPAVVKASAGAALHLPVARIGNVVETLRKLKEQGYWAVGLDRQGEESLEPIDPSLSLVIVVGGETGLRRLVRESCDFLVALPMRGKVESLNLSVAAGILLYRLLDRLQNNEKSG